MTLARQAAALNARGAATGLPALILMSDDERLPDPRDAARNLPPGSLVILRMRDSVRRHQMAQNLKVIADEKTLLFSIAGDPELAYALGADGVHLAESHIASAARLRLWRPHWLITAAAHSLHAMARARLCRADAVILGNVFPTKSHPGRAALGISCARRLAAAAPLPAYALGGIDARTARALSGSAFVGLAAIGALA